MLFTPNCKIRNCLYFEGAIQPDGTEATEVVVCAAFPKGIPEDIAYGTNKHTKPIKGQIGAIVFTQKKEK